MARFDTIATNATLDTRGFLRCNWVMNNYVAIFSKIVDSSLWDEPDYVVKVFLTMLAKKDADQIVRASAYAIGRWARKEESEVLKALERLQTPDKARLEKQEFGGRRVEKVPEGWLILRGKYYQDLMVEVNRRARKANAERERRAREKLLKGKPLSGETTAIKRMNDGASTEEIDSLVERSGQ